MEVDFIKSKLVASKKIVIPEEDFLLMELFTKQEELMDKYVSKGSLPQYPFKEIDSKKNQSFIRELISRVTEELTESYQQRTVILANYTSNTSIREVGASVFGLAEEIGDTLHFFIELLIYCKVTFQTLSYHIAKQCSERGIILSNPTWELYYAIEVGKNAFKETHHTTSITDTRITGYAFGHKQVMDIWTTAYPALLDVADGGYHINPKTLDIEAQQCWLITMNLYWAQNLLKNKAWKETGVETNIPVFQERLMDTFLLYLGYLAYLGYTQKSIYSCYAYKNVINHKRISEKY